MEEQDKHQGHDEELGVKLSVKQMRFIEEYTLDFNATAAAIRAGYSEKSARAIGCENLTKPDIKEAIKKRIDELKMSADEALLRLAEFARADFTPFLIIDENNNVTVDLTSEAAQRRMYLIKKIKQTKRTIGGTDIVDVTTEIEIHDAKDAVKSVLQVHGKLIDKREIDHTSKGEKINPTMIVFTKGSRDSGN
ncbi:terminase small subunit [Dyadobacter sp. CY351]|uniref:terminase small subunit n=1 Tax=Dyadobacter sp. CY351 TaxID=2909337 RepID=UPI001F1D1292|nr:terminase small subunit [Dyadobacter sp. CY351]MCF2517139.1 terminase small subunit [Dyadobacter sp. CY351]